MQSFCLNFYRTILILTAILLSCTMQNLCAQTGRGTIISQNNKALGTTRAVVVGVSEYRNLPENRQLNFADDDAMLFYALLQRLYQGEEQDNLKLITNSEASAALIKETISALIEESEKGDRLIFYFAGHGDVFSDSARNIDDAFLLCHNVSTDADYSISDALSMKDLHSLISEGLQKDITVLMITDACRSGKYATSQNSAFATARVLSEKWGRISRIASCQANESSYEDLQWGGGHGAFTWYLIDGMSGAADEMNDSLVDLSELEFFVKRSVRVATLKKQNPVFFGDANTGIAKVTGERFDKTMNVESLLASRAGSDVSFTSDTSVNRIISHFLECLQSGCLLEPAGACAWSYYQDLQKSPADNKTLRKAKGSLFVALDQSAQKILDIYLSGSGNMPPAEAFDKAARELAAARGLFSAKHSLTKKMLPRQLFLEAWAIIRAENRPGYKTAEKKLKKSVKLEKSAAYAYNALGKLYLLNEQFAASEMCLRKAIERAPRWTYPKSNLGLVYSNRKMWAHSESVFKALVNSDSTFSWGFNNLGCLYFDQGKYDQSRLLWQKASKLQPTDPVPVMNLGTVAREQGRLADAIHYFKMAAALDTLYADVLIKMGNYYSTFNDSLKQAEQCYLKAVSLEPFFAEYYNELGNFYKSFDVTLGIHQKAEDLFKKAIELDPFNEDAYYNLGSFYLQKGDENASAKIMKKGVKKCKRSARSLYLIAINSWNRKEYAEAENFFLQSIERDPLHLNAYLKLAEFYEQRNRPADAEKLYRDAVDKFTDSPLLCYGLANFYFRNNAVDSAIKWYRKSLEEDSLYSYGWSSLAYIYLKKDLFATARDFFLKAQQLNPYKHNTAEFAYLVRSRADSLSVRALASGSGSEFSTTVDAYKTALSLEPANAGTALALARLYYLFGNTDQALEQTDVLLGYTDTPVQLKDALDALRARIFIDAGKPEQALALCEKLIANDPFPSYLTKAIALLKLGRNAEARTFYKLEQQENPQNLDSKWQKSFYSPASLELINQISVMINE